MDKARFGLLVLGVFLGSLFVFGANNEQDTRTPAEKVPITEYPHHVWIRLFEPRIDTCVGIIMSPELILTSTTCVQRYVINKILVGTSYNVLDKKNAKLFIEESIITHNDLSFIKLRGSMEMGKNAQPLKFTNATLPSSFQLKEDLLSVGSRAYYIFREPAHVISDDDCYLNFGLEANHTNRFCIKAYTEFAWSFNLGNPVFLNNQFYGVIIENQYQNAYALVVTIENYREWMTEQLNADEPEQNIDFNFY